MVINPRTVNMYYEILQLKKYSINVNCVVWFVVVTFFSMCEFSWKKWQFMTIEVGLFCCSRIFCNRLK